MQIAPSVALPAAGRRAPPFRFHRTDIDNVVGWGEDYTRYYYGWVPPEMVDEIYVQANVEYTVRSEWRWFWTATYLYAYISARFLGAGPPYQLKVRIYIDDQLVREYTSPTGVAWAMYVGNLDGDHVVKLAVLSTSSGPIRVRYSIGDSLLLLGGGSYLTMNSPILHRSDMVLVASGWIVPVGLHGNVVEREIEVVVGGIPFRCAEPCTMYFSGVIITDYSDVARLWLYSDDVVSFIIGEVHLIPSIVIYTGCSRSLAVIYWRNANSGNISAEVCAALSHIYRPLSDVDAWPIHDMVESVFACVDAGADYIPLCAKIPEPAPPW